jgi:ribosome modulation factor
MWTTSLSTDLKARLAWWTKRGTGAVFDAFHGVNTCSAAAAEKLEITSVNRDKGIAYDTCPWSTLRRSMHLVSLPAEGFTFVDIGCGKGKVLLSAMVLPFKRIVGVEYSAYLSRVAEQNIASARYLRQRCSSVEIICTDAAEYVIPDESTIFFFANPFAYDVMEIVLGNIVNSYAETSRPIYLLFYRASSIMPRINGFLRTRSGGRAHRLISTNLGSRSLNIFALPDLFLTDDQLERAADEGRAAWRQRRTRSDCPYQDDAGREAWLEGFDEACLASLVDERYP